MLKRFIFILLLVLTSVAHADMQIIVPFSTGGAYDTLGRRFEKFLTKEGEHAVVINVPGAGGYIGHKKLEAITKPAIMVTSSAFLIQVAGGKISLSDYKIISVFGDAPQYIVANKKAEITCEKLKKSTNEYFIGHGGYDSMTSLPAVWMSEKYKNIREVPYKSASNAMNDVIANQIHMTVIAGYVARPDLDFIANTTDKSIEGIPSLNQCLGIPKLAPAHYLLVTNATASDEFVKKMNGLALKFANELTESKYFKEERIRSKVSDVPGAERIVRYEIENLKLVLK